jgi:hypothetical protein
MTFHLRKPSLDALQNLHPELVRVVERAIQIPTQDLWVREAPARA